jgi:hypothetical protein
MKAIFLLLFLLIIPVVIAANPRIKDIQDPSISGQLVLDNGTVITQNNNNTIVVQEPPKGGQVIDLSKPNPSPPVVNNGVTVIPVKHSFWWYLWPPHWWGK